MSLITSFMNLEVKFLFLSGGGGERRGERTQKKKEKKKRKSTLPLSLSSHPLSPSTLPILPPSLSPLPLSILPPSLSSHPLYPPTLYIFVSFLYFRFRVCEYIYKKRHLYDKILLTYVNDKTRCHQAFSFVRSTLREKTSPDVRERIMTVTLGNLIVSHGFPTAIPTSLF